MLRILVGVVSNMLRVAGCGLMVKVRGIEI